VAGIIEVEDLAKRFSRRALRASTFKETFVRPFRRASAQDWFWALDGVSFAVAPGQLLGVIGSNGSGKSTLLRLVGGIGRPDRGGIRREGRVLPMLELGLGFHPDLTGEENVYISGVIHGLTRREIRQQMDSIVAFAELPHVMQSPLRTYSAGMRLRLAFAVAAHCEPEIMLIDEVLTVGDLAFQNKCLKRISAFQASGCSIILVSHDINQVRRIASSVLWLNGGKVKMLGDPAHVTDAYQEFMEAGANVNGPPEQNAPLLQGEVEIQRVRLLDPSGAPITAAPQGGACVVEAHFTFHKRVESPMFFVELTRTDGFKACSINTAAIGVDTSQLPERGVLRVTFERLDLSKGDYFVDVAVFAPEFAFAYDYKWHVQSLSIDAGYANEGAWHPPTRWEFSRGE
jgi:lipopolysaccharide transport system ATP-binding protein